MTRTALTGAIILTLLAAPSIAQSDEQPVGDKGVASEPRAQTVAFAPDAIEWVAGPRFLPKGATIAVLAGDLNKEGPFVLRLKLPDGYRLPPHKLVRQVGVTVMAGTCHVGEGETFNAERTTALPAGSYASPGPGAAHFVWFEGETIVQLHGEGPWSIDYLNKADDPRQGTAGRRAALRVRIEFTDESLEEVKRNVDAGKAVMVDVRSKEEWNQGNIEGSIFLPNDSLRGRAFDPDKLGETLPEGKVLYAFCQVGMRAKAAAKVLTQYGYEVKVLKPGYEELLEAGFEKSGEGK